MVILTGKAKEDFHKWYESKKYRKDVFTPHLNKFYAMPDSMQWGLYVDFFDSIGIFIDVYHVRTNPGTEFHIKINGNYSGLNNSRIKAFEVGVNMANEIYNA